MSAWARVWGDFRAMVRDYNKRKLSVETDKPPAIAALAETYASHIQGDYLAGLWRRYLVYDLIWSANNTRPEVSKSGSPSWSWAVINGEVSFDYSNSIYATAETVDCSVTVVSDKAPFGAVTGGELVIRGYLKEVQVHKGGGFWTALARVSRQDLQVMVMRRHCVETAWPSRLGYVEGDPASSPFWWEQSDKVTVTVV
jgi:hypothetical protein